MRNVVHVLLAGFAGITIMLGYWQIFDAGNLKQKQFNAQTAYYEQKIRRGKIRTNDGVVLARSARHITADGDLTWKRKYPRDMLAPHVVGYSTSARTRTGIERRHNDLLTGSTTRLASVSARLRGNETVRGDDVILTIRSKVQRAAEQALAGKEGAIVAIEPATGRIIAMASSPAFSPRSVADSYQKLANQPGAPLLNRATRGQYAPGSTFKLITASAALESGITADEMFAGGCTWDAKSGPPVANYGGSCVGSHDLETALTKSINTTFAELGDRLGGDAIRKQMKAYGFDQSAFLEDLPQGEVDQSGLRASDGKLLADDEGVDPARLAIGQERLAVTPLQMAVVVATIANGGIPMEPYLVETAIQPDQDRIKVNTPRKRKPAISAQTSAELTRMMQGVVREGTGTAAALSGIDVAGKTGTADTPSGNQVWFTGFAPAIAPEIAVAVTLEGQPSGTTGGANAAPLARLVMEAALK